MKVIARQPGVLPVEAKGSLGELSGTVALRISKGVSAANDKLAEFVRWAQDHPANEWVFRGHSNEDWRLQPSVGHGLPTRLVDWTFNSLVACFLRARRLDLATARTRLVPCLGNPMKIESAPVWFAELPLLLPAQVPALGAPQHVPNRPLHPSFPSCQPECRTRRPSRRCSHRSAFKTQPKHGIALPAGYDSLTVSRMRTTTVTDGAQIRSSVQEPIGSVPERIRCGLTD